MNTSLKKFSNVFKQEGTSRQERYVPALHETSALLDDRQLQDMILYMRQYAGNLLFIDTEKEHIDYGESWEDFFANDPILLIAGIASLQTQKIKQEYDHLSNLFRSDPGTGNFAELARYVLARFVEINSWYTLAPKDSILHQDITLYIGSYLQKETDNIKEMILYCFDHLGDDTDNDAKTRIHARNEKTRKELRAMDAIWKLDDTIKLQLRDKIFRGNDEKEKLTNAAVVLDKIFETVYYATENITLKSKKYFDETLLHKQTHSPHTALAVTFIRLFQYQQAELNKIPQRLLGFYYRDLLKIKNKPAIPDQAVVVLELAKGFDYCLVKKGTRLSAGKDQGNHELVYTADKDTVLNKAKIAALHTAFIERDVSGNILNYYTGIINETPGQVTAVAETVNIPKMFGAPDTASIARVGFAISSSQLYLSGGERNVIIQFRTSGNTLPAGKTIECNKDSISLLLTAEKGWISSETAKSGIQINSLTNDAGGILELNFTISAAQEQAIIGFDKKLHEGNYDTWFPVLQCLLKFPEANREDPATAERIHQLNMLQQLRVTASSIRVEVGSRQGEQTEMGKLSFDGVRDLMLENDDAVLNSKKPFYPFTPIPKVNTSFYIGCKDLFYKNIQSLSINVEWLLPENYKTYYQKYNPPYDSNKFASLEFLEKNRWKKYNDVSLINVNAKKPNFRLIEMDMDQARSGATVPEDAFSTFENIKKNGTLRLKLQHPDFGHGIYPQLITSVIMDKAKPTEEKDKSERVNYYQLVKKELHDDVFTITLPPGLDDPKGRLRPIYDTLSRKKENDVDLKKALSDIISEFNNVPQSMQNSAIAPDALDEQGSREVVHDQNFLERLLRIRRRLFGGERHNDRNTQGVGDVTQNLEEDILKVANFVLPSRADMMNLTVMEIHKNINQTVGNAIQLMIEARDKTNSIDPAKMKEILEEEFKKATMVLNDMIAKRIAGFLSASEIPPPPYSPLINAISLNYSSEKNMSRNDGDKIFHITMAGNVAETSIWEDNKAAIPLQDDLLVKTNYLIPPPLSAKVDKKNVYMQGMLFAGIKDAVPNQNLSVFFQLTNGASTNFTKAPPDLYCYYMRHNEWMALKKDHIVSDSTHGLLTAGIIEFTLPADADNISSFFNTTGLCWLCVAVAGNTDAFPDLIDAKPQAIQVTFNTPAGNPRHMTLPLPADKLKKTIDELPAVKKITQPLPSFNGKAGENDHDYFVRVSERLRHKSRAINNWDYEHLLLEEFPWIFKVKCLNNYCNGHFAPGHVSMVPIPDVQNEKYAGSNIRVPRVNYIDLKKMEEFLSYRSSPFVKVHALNPKPEYILITCTVKFYTGVDKGFYLQLLNKDLVDFLTPWATGTGHLSFSGKVYASSIINFIDKREYIDYVTALTMNQYTEDDKGERVYVADATNNRSLVETALTTNHSILVSAPVHIIKLAE